MVPVGVGVGINGVGLGDGVGVAAGPEQALRMSAASKSGINKILFKAYLLPFLLVWAQKK